MTPRAPRTAQAALSGFDPLPPLDAAVVLAGAALADSAALLDGVVLAAAVLLLDSLLVLPSFLPSLLSDVEL